MYKVNDIFYSLQGEGYFTGTPAVFVRLSGCNLHCDFCDTDFSAFELMTSRQIVRKAREILQQQGIECPSEPASNTKDINPRWNALKTPICVLTGGEPTLQVDHRLVRELHCLFNFITIETNGTNPVPDDIDWVTCSPKTMTNLRIQHVDELKMVYTGQNVELFFKHFKAEQNYLQPCSQKNTKEVVEYIQKHPWWSLSLQTHKMIGIH